jgi:hypothetical protein
VFPESRKSPYPNQQKERLEKWETNAIECLNTLNQMEIFTTAKAQKFAKLQLTIDKLYASVSFLKTRIGEEDDQVVEDYLDDLPSYNETDEVIESFTDFHDSISTSIEALTQRTAWQNVDLILAKRDLYLDNIPNIPIDIEECLRFLPIHNELLFAGKLNKAHELIKERNMSKVGDAGVVLATKVMQEESRKKSSSRRAAKPRKTFKKLSYSGSRSNNKVDEPSFPDKYAKQQEKKPRSAYKPKARFDKFKSGKTRFNKN